MDDETLMQFLTAYDPDRSRTVLDIEVPPGDVGLSPFIVVRYGANVVVLNPMGLSDHLSLDAHVFRDGHSAVAGVFGMEVGKRTTLQPFTGPSRTSHGFVGTPLVVLLVGEQGVRGD